MTDPTFATPSPGGRNPAAASDDIRTAAHDAAEQTHARLAELVGDGAELLARGGRGGVDLLIALLAQAGDGLGEDQGWARQVFSQGADGLERVSSYLRDGRMDTFARDVQGFARSNPAAFLAGSVALGFLAARIAKTAAEHAVPAAQPTTAYTAPPTGMEEPRSFAPADASDLDPTMRDL